MNFINEMSTMMISEKIILPTGSFPWQDGGDTGGDPGGNNDLPTGKFFWQNDGQLDDGQQDVGQEDPILNIQDHF